ncbi:MAG TPA: UPF0182 family protein [Methylomirabilota bacterium]|nr:UPF0182 family protein [Methylomirabilota bacterium]
MANGRRSPRLGFWLVLAFIVLAGLGQAVPLYTDWLWYREVGFTQVFTTVLSLRGWLFLGVGGVVFLFMYGNLWVAARTAAPDVLWELDDQLGLPGRAVLEPLIRRLLLPVIAVIAVLSGLRAGASWEMVVGYVNATPFGATDPLFGRDLSFFVFELPLWRFLYGGAMTLVIGTLLLSVATYVLLRSLVLTAQGPRLAAGARIHLLGLGAVLLLLRALGFWLDRYELLYSARGVVFGASYTDVHATLPALSVLTALAFLCAAACVLQISRPGWGFLVAGLVVLAVVWAGGLGVWPSLLQRFQVTPNELVAERPYIEHNIRMTRQAYGLESIKEQDFPAEDRLTSAAIERNSLTIKNIRLWDHRPLLTSFAQLQEIRTYYKFAGVDVDRYTVNGEYRQIMLSPREMSYQHLPSRVWINEHLTFTHGFGLVAGPVNRITPEGLPDLWVKDIPPNVSGGFPKITRPEIYYGELSNEYVIVRTKSQELDYPAGDQNVYSRYSGRGGVPVGGFLRKLAFAIRFGEIKILLSDDLSAESRVMMYRRVGDRVRQATPFIRFDHDPYLVVTGDGRLVWIVDGYTTTDRYPYAQPEHGLNYIRNSVKVTVDAFDGTMVFYVADPKDPLIRTWARAFPGLFTPLERMPAELRPHVRYPEDLFSLQAKMYGTYHMQDPQVFYNKEDLWTVPHLTFDGRDREMEPYFTIMRLPGEKTEEFVLLSGFNPARRDNMIAIIAARSDAPNYGSLIAYTFPKQKLVYGPRQIDARVNQDPVISAAFSLWNQQGSRVLRGSLLAIPIEGSLIYVQPIYLSAEQGALPELRRVIVAFGNQIAMEPTLEQSLQRIFGGSIRGDEPTRARGADGKPAPGTPTAMTGLVQRAWESWQRGQDALKRGDWTAYGQAQKQLEETLRQLRESR